jgi:hypothetical protein
VRYALVVARLPEEYPVVSSLPFKIFLFEPAWGFLLVPSPGPLPQTSEDDVINAVKGAFTHHVPVIIDPTPYFGVEPINQSGSRHAPRGFDYLPDAAQKGFNILLGRLDEQFPVRVRAHVLSEEIKTFPHMCDDRLRGRKFQTSFLQELLDEGLNFSFQ